MNDAIRKPFAESSEENKRPILRVLAERLSTARTVLEIGSGTGQHAVYFGEAMPMLIWQTSELPEMHAGIRLWLDEAGLGNVLNPIALDVEIASQWPDQQYDAVYSANTAHIMSADGVAAMFSGIGRILNRQGQFLLYGPFMYSGKHTAPSNEQFDHWLRIQAPHRGVRDLVWLKQLAKQSGMELSEDLEMPVNNRILVWRKI